MFELIPFDRSIRSLNNFDPFREMDNFRSSFFGGSSACGLLRSDVSDVGNAYILEAELPGFKKEDISIDIENDCLTISASRKADSEEKNGSYIKRERFTGSCRRCFDVSGVNTEAIDASYTDGILTVNMPKKQENIPASRKLEIR